MTKRLIHSISFLWILLLSSCSQNENIVNHISEREANEIIVFLASNGITAQKIIAASSAIGTNTSTNEYSIVVANNQSTEAMALLNRYGLPRRKGTTLLELFAPQGLMSSSREETIRYQAGLAEELRNTIRKIDGVIDADVQISFPDSNANQPPGATPQKITAAVFVKHQGVLEDPNSHLEVKIKRLLAGSINGLDYDSVSVISDRSRFADITLAPQTEAVGIQALEQTHASLWGVVMTQNSLTRFRSIFFTFIFLFLAMAAALGWLVYRFYPELRKKPTSTESESDL